MDPEVKSYLYPGSFFLPYIVPDESTTRIRQYLVEDQNTSLLMAITYETLELGNYKMYVQREKFNQLEWLFQTTDEDLGDYVSGFRLPCSLVLAAHMLENHVNLKAIIKIFTSPINPQKSQEFITYLLTHIFTAQSFFQNPENSLVEIAQPIYEICAQTPFIDSLYYRIGHAASEAVFADLCNLVSE